VAVAVLVSLFVSFTLDPMLSSIWRDSADQPPPQRAGARQPDARHRPGARRAARHLRALDPLDSSRGATNRSCFPPIPAFARPCTPKKARQRRRRDAGASPRHAARARSCSRHRSFVGAILLAPRVGTEFIPSSDNSYIQMNVELPVGTSLERGSEKLRRSRR
jgi:multidrug efflux pump subunit AcrB